MTVEKRGPALVDWLLEQIAADEAAAVADQVHMLDCEARRRMIGEYRDCAADVDLARANDSVSVAQQRVLSSMTASLRELAESFAGRAGYVDSWRR